MDTRARNVLYWSPRVLGAMYVLAISLFAFQAWGLPGGMLYRLGEYLIYLVPTYIVIAVLLIAWVRPHEGGYAFLFIAFGFAFLFDWREMGTLLGVSLPLFLIGTLFLIDYWVDAIILRPRF